MRTGQGGPALMCVGPPLADNMNQMGCQLIAESETDMTGMNRLRRICVE